MTQVVGAFRQFKGLLVKVKGSLTGSSPCDAVRRCVDVFSRGVAEQTSVGCDAEASYVLAQHADEHPGDTHRLGGLGRLPFQGVRLVDRTVVCPLLARSQNAALQIQKSPAAQGQAALGFLQVNDLGRAHG
ncbi:hypothetical protein ACWGDX_12505 [Streptomyces sp. NPDC055025]